MNPIRHTRKDELLTARMNMPGTGKTAIVEGLDRRAVLMKCPSSSSTKAFRP
ncbi:hypothetical protein [uncultured Akkermansia sp.]|uniref:hypothetical protein n=1 Tax=uncultured Akkermansia sp. TaxID=512294 RepID=UPI00262753BC|nr:hypothetical protein [uncultured Akkermansia sp.]